MYPADVEKVLIGHPDVLDAVLVVRVNAVRPGWVRTPRGEGR